MTEKKRTVKFCSLGLGGNSMQYGHGCTGSWYAQSPEEVGQHYSHELTEGVILLDKRPALESNTAFAFASPMVNVDMSPGERDDFGSRYTERDGFMIDALKETGYGGVIRAAEIAAEVAPEVPGPLDYVPIDYFVKWWTERGAIAYRWDGAAFVKV